MFSHKASLGVGVIGRPNYNTVMTEKESKIVETLAHAKDAAAVLKHIDLKVDSPATAGAKADILAADASLETAIDTLKSIQKEAEKKS